jgi:hypothetical protein
MIMRSGTFVLAFSAVVLVLGQVDTGTLTGIVRDASGAAVPRAKVHIVNDGTGQEWTLSADEAGLYVSTPLRPGEYTIEVEAAGFEKAAKRTRLDVAQRAQLDFELQLGSISQTVKVQESAPVLQAETSTLSNLRNERAIKDLPLNGRNFAQLIGLASGSMPTNTQQTGSPIVNKRGPTGYAVNGMRWEDNSFLVEGMNNNENHNGFGILIFPPIDAVEQFRVETSVADAQFGRGGGGTVNLTFKSGTKDFHGDAFEFLRNASLDAKNFFDSPAAKIPPFKQNQFGGTLGGPLFPWAKEHRTFFFVDYEGTRVRQAQTLISSVPTFDFRQGDFSAAPQRIYDPLTQQAAPGGGFVRDPFPTNRVPANRMDPVGRNMLGLFPLPNLGSALANNYLRNPVRATTGNSADIKVDRNFSTADNFFTRYSFSRFELVDATYLPTPAVGSGPGNVGRHNQPVDQGLLSETHIFSPNKVNEARFGFTRLNMRSLNPNYGNYVSTDIGLPGANVPGDILTSGLSIISIPGLRSLGDPGFSPAVLVSEDYQFNDNFTYIRGKHTIKIGGTVLRLRYNPYQSSSPRGTMNFALAYTINPAAPQGTGIGAAEVLLGRPNSGFIQFLEGTRGFRRTELASYIQDDFKVTERLTLNLGLRYENFVHWPWTEVANRMYQFVPATQDLVRVGTGNIPSAGTGGDNTNFGPRVGLAYKLDQKTVLRAGYGVFYLAPQVEIANNLAGNPPELIASAYSNNQFDFLGSRQASMGFDRPATGVIDGSQINSIDPHARTAYVQQWNLSLQRELAGSVGLTVSYVGTKGTKLGVRANINQPVPGITPIVQRRPFPRFQSIFDVEDRLSSNYQGLQIAAERRLAAGLNFQLAYTLSHAIDFESGEITNSGSPMDVRNIRLDRGNADFDVRHRMVASWEYELPFKASGPARHAIQGWQLNGILSLYGGLPFSVSSATNTLNIGQGTRADRLRSGALAADQKTPDLWFDISAFGPPGPQLFGNSGRNILTGPGTRELDFSLFKNFYIDPEKPRRVQFRAEFFNLTNTPQFNNPNSTVGAPGAGTITSAGSPVTLQRTSRQIQFALKLYF